MKKTILIHIPSMKMDEASRIMLNIINSWDSSKYEIVLLLDFFEGELLLEMPWNIKIFTLARGKGELSKVKAYRFLQLGAQRIILTIYRFFPAFLKKKLNNIIPDIEIAISPASLSRLVRSPFKNSKKINWLHSDIHFYSRKQGHKILSMMHQCDVTVFISHLLKEEFERYLNRKIFNDLYIPPVFNIEEIKTKLLEDIDVKWERLFTGNVKTFVSIGPLVYEKGYDVLLESHLYLIKRGYSHKIIVMGQGPEYSVLKKKIESEGVQNSFFLIGFQENPYPYIGRADYYIQPSRHEVYPLSVGEAMILGKPLISTDASRTAELVEHTKTGFITGCSQEELAMAMKKFLLDPDFTLDMIIHQQQKDFILYNEFARKQLELIVQ